MSGSRRAIRIVGTGMALPGRVVDSEEIDARLGLASGTTFARCGVRRRHASVDETAAGLAVRACDAALDRAGLCWSDIDCLVAASATPDQALPFNAALVLDAVGERIGPRSGPIAAFDIGASCLSFVAALDTMSVLVDQCRYRHVLIVSADIATFALDWSVPEASVLFGDGAAAVLIRRSRPDEASAVLASRIETFPEGASASHIRAGGSRFHPARIDVDGDFDAMTRFHMDGPRLFRIAARELPRLVAEVLAEAGTTMAAMRVVVPHQASRLALDHLSRRLAIEPARLMDILADHGNQVAASLPTALHRAIVDGRVQRGDSLLLIGSGAGVTLGGLMLVY